MSKDISTYATEAPTGQAQAFIEWVTVQTGLTFKSAKEQAAFERGLFLGIRGYSMFQQSNREAAAAKAVRKPRSRKAA